MAADAILENKLSLLLIYAITLFMSMQATGENKVVQKSDQYFQSYLKFEEKQDGGGHHLGKKHLYIYLNIIPKSSFRLLNENKSCCIQIGSILAKLLKFEEKQDDGERHIEYKKLLNNAKAALGEICIHM